MARRWVEPLTARCQTVPPKSDDVGSLFFTSGTTGPSKAVATTWHYLFTVAATVASAWEFGPGEVLWTGDAAVSPERGTQRAGADAGRRNDGAGRGLFIPVQVWDEVRAHGAIGFAGAGAMVSMLQNQPADPRDAQLPLRFISAAPIDANSYHEIEKRYGCRIVTMYGMTEAFPIAVKGVAEEGVPGTRAGRTQTSKCASWTTRATRYRLERSARSRAGQSTRR